MIFQFQGRHYPSRNNLTAQNPNLPLETFSVKKDKKYRFRTVCSSMTFAFRISIDKHQLNVITLDGIDVYTKTFQSYIIFPGERLAFWIEANDPDELGSYWIRAETLEVKQYSKVRSMIVYYYNAKESSSQIQN